MQKNPFAYLRRVYTGVNEKGSGESIVTPFLPIFLHRHAVKGSIDRSQPATHLSGFIPNDHPGVPDHILIPDPVYFLQSTFTFSEKNLIMITGVNGDIFAPVNTMPCCRFRFLCANTTLLTECKTHLFPEGPGQTDREASSGIIPNDH